MEGSLVESLNHKLEDLDDKVRTYRHDKQAEFQRFYRDLLCNVSPAVAADVEQAIVRSFSSYPALRPQLDQTDSRMNHNHNPDSTTTAFQVGPSQSSPLDSPSSPHEREQEFQGLFTPSYLPLLDSAPRQPAPPQPIDAGAPEHFVSIDNGISVPPGPGPPGSGPDKMLSSITEPSGSPFMGEPGKLDEQQGDATASSQTPNRPHHVRQSTDDTTTSSMSSERGEAKVPRSALRRSSTGSRPPSSPRRVRFDFKGHEVLPTSSPQPSEYPTPRPSSPLPDPDNSVLDSMLGEDEEEFNPPPRKVSSSDALRALSRAPLDEATVWTVVNADEEDSNLVQQSSLPPAQPPSLANSTPTRDSQEFITETPDIRQKTPVLASLHEVSQEEEEDDEDDEDDEDGSSDEEFLAMAKPKSFAAKGSIRSPSSVAENTVRNSARSSIAHGTSATSLPIKQAEVENDQASSDDVTLEDEEEEDDMFHFEAGGLSAPPKPRPRPLQLRGAESDDDTPELAQDSLRAAQAKHQRSPVVDIAKRSTSPSPQTPTTAKFQAGSVGSYKGRSVVMPVVRDPEVHARAASLGEFNTFVGGLDGRSGMDEGDLNSFRASMVATGFSGTPRSLTERLFIEESQKQRSSSDDSP